MLASVRSQVRWLAPFALVLAVAACSGTAPSSDGGSGGSRSGASRSGPSESSAQKLERRRDAKPDDFQARLELADQYYELARKAIDDGKQTEYVDYLRKAQAELLEATRINPTSPQPHTQMGIITAYLGDLDAAETSFKNALRLSLRDRRELTTGIYYSNLAHIAVYQGKLNEARRYLDKAVKNQAPAPDDEISRIMVLASWKENDMVEARDLFNNAALNSRPFAETWDSAPLPRPMKTFSDFAQECCKNPTCGPHMEGACQREKQAVSRREIQLDTLQQEMQLERDRRAKLKEIYQKRRDVEITVDDPNAAKIPDSATPGSSAPQAPASSPAPASAPKKSAP